MGGTGSGRRPTGLNRIAVEECLSIPVGRLSKTGLLSGQVANVRLTWSSGDQAGTSLLVGAKTDSQTVTAVNLQYNVGAGDDASPVEQPIGLARSRMPYGGERVWFSCPACDRRAGVLYLPPGQRLFACRACHRLRYGRELRNKWFPREVNNG
jgi:hypothetical protein